jgi:hypothetical protein
VALGLLSLLCSLALILVAAKWGDLPLGQWIAGALLVLAAFSAFSALAAGVAALREDLATLSSAPPAIDERLQGATRALQEARNLMAELERELQARQTRLEALSAEYQQAEQLAQVNREAAAALRQELGQVVKGESRRMFWFSSLSGIPLGVAAGLISAWLLGLFGRH